MKAKTIIFLIILSILIINVNASANTTNAYNWLLSQSQNGSYGDIETTSFAISALQFLSPITHKQNSTNYLKSQQNALNCWPLASCDSKSTSIALKTLAESNEVVNSSWLASHQLSELPGNWLLQIITSNSGLCTFTYKINNQEYIKPVNVKKGYFSDCGNTTWLNLDGTCLSTNLIKSNPSLLFSVGCNMSVERMTVTYSYSNNYYPSVYQQTGSAATFKINNGCFGTSTCDYLTTLYANWAFKKMNIYSTDVSKTFNSLFWLKYGNAYQDKTSYNALLYLITNEASYLEKIKSAQQVFPLETGSYGYWPAESNPSLSSAYVTSLALLALRGTTNTDYITKAEKWFEINQLADGSFNDNTLDTSLALYSLNFATSLPACTENWNCTAFTPSICTSSLSQTRSCNDLNNCGTIYYKPIESQSCACQENWTCTSWTPSTCTYSNIQNRTCIDTSSCGTNSSKPAESQTCSCQENWVYSAWSTCSNGQQTRTAADSNNCGTTLNREALTQSCSTQTCSQQNGKICANSENCPGSWLSSSDTTKCCSVNCTSVNETCSDLDGFECSSSETCSGTIMPAADTTECCDEECAITIEDCGDTVCDEDKECSTCSSDCLIEDCCGNNVCNSILGEDTISCPQDCTCIENNDCEVSEGENLLNCPNDCYCGNDKCEPTEDAKSCPGDCKTTPLTCEIGESCSRNDCIGEYDSNCKCSNLECPPERAIEICDDKIDNDEDKLIDCKDSDCAEDSACEKKKSPIGSILIIFAIIILLGIGYFLFQKFKGGKPSSGSSKKPPSEFRPFTSRLEKEKPEAFKTIMTPFRQGKTKVEEELERSIEEAKKILKK